jgi:cell envelope-related function transcriptional attenuator common domain
MNDLDLLRAWRPGDAETSADYRADARAKLDVAMSDGELAVVTSSSTQRRFFGRALVAGVVTLALAVGGFVFATREVNDRIDQVKRVTLPAGTLDHSNLTYPMTILVVGSDSRAFVQDAAQEQAFGSASAQGGQRADVMLLVRLTETTTTAVSLPRDLMVPYGRGGTRQLNSFFDQGPQTMIDAIKTNLKVPIDHYVQVNFTAFMKVVDAVGGVRMSVPQRVRDVYSGLNLAGTGCTDFDGNAALALVRSRHLEIFDGARWVDGSGQGDLDRIARQQRFTRALLAQTHATMAEDPTRAADIADSVTSLLTVDSGMSRATILDLVRRFRADDPAAWRLTTIPVVPNPTDRNRWSLAHPDADVFARTVAGDAGPRGPLLGDAC